MENYAGGTSEPVHWMNPLVGVMRGKQTSGIVHYSKLVLHRYLWAGTLNQGPKKKLCFRGGGVQLQVLHDILLAGTELI